MHAFALRARDRGSLLTARGLTKSFARGLSRTSRRTVAIAGVDVEISAGEVVGLCGEEGAGKTTLLQCLAGLLRGDSGRIEMSGSHRDADFRGWVSYVPGTPVYYPFLTVRDVLELRAARARQSSHGDRSVDRALTALGLIRESGCRVGLLRQETVKRVAVAEALVCAPRLLLVDTCSPVPDVVSGTMLDALYAYASRGNAVVIASRDRAPLRDAVSRAVFIEKGRVVPFLTGNAGPCTGNPGHATDNEQLAAGNWPR